jgi:hypothetical protein
MSDKRKPSLTILLKKPGKKLKKVEMFPGTLWPEAHYTIDNLSTIRFRIRVNGKWWPDGKFELITRSEVWRLLRPFIK